MISTVRGLHRLRVMLVDPSTLNDITRRILGAAIEVHRTLGPGLLESIYLQCLKRELAEHQQRFVEEHVVPVVYKGTTLNAHFRADLIVEDLVVVEVKAVAALLPIFHAQTLTYLHLTGCPAGLIINFNVPRLMDGVKRVINPRATKA